MNFFEHQEASRRRTRRLLLAFAVAVLAVVVAVTWVLVSLVSIMSDDQMLASGGWLSEHLGVTLITALFVFGIIGAASLVRMSQLSGGGGAVARAVGAQRVTRESTDPLRRRLLNVVEEMAIASGVPVPEVYVLEQETGINAFAAGLSTSDAAVAVTRGALERLNRAELSGVIGHEFSHILNGDMRLNTRLAGPLFGLLIIATAARHLLRNLRGGSGGRKGGAIVLAILAVMALGYLGVFLGRLLQSAISRQREFLADASSAQFTRDPGALRDALVRIARSSRGTRLTAADSEDLAHMFFLPAYSRLFATHPPLAERVKALDPRYPLQELEKVEAETLQVAGEEMLTSESGVGVAGFTGNAQQVAVAPGQIAGSVGRPGLDHVAYARALRESLPPELDEALKRGSTAACAWLALLLHRDGPVRDRQLQDIEATFGAPVAQHVRRLEPAARALPLVQRLPLLQRAMPVLRAVPAERRRMLAALTHRLAAADGQVEVFEFALSHLAGQYLAEQIASPARVRSETIDACQDELGVLFAALASHGHDSPIEARRAYERGISHVLPRQRPAYAAPASADWTGPLDRALQRLDRLPPLVKEVLVEGLGRTATHDGLIQVNEAELLRAACAALHCPLPPLLEGSGTPAGNSQG